MAHAIATSPPASSRLLGLLGILGGAVLLAAYVVNIAPEINPLRLVLFCVGAMAIVIGVHRRQASVAPAPALLAAVPALVANAWYLAMVVLPISPYHLFAGDNGLVSFAAGVALWLTEASFGLVTLRLGVVTRWGALALAIGSVLALSGMDRLGLVSGPNETIFQTLSQIGLALNGLGWILLGFDVASGGRLSMGRPAPTSEVIVRTGNAA